MLTLGAGQTEHDDLSHERKTFCRGPQNRELGSAEWRLLSVDSQANLLKKKASNG
jgi:hypothetical protein